MFFSEGWRNLPFFCIYKNMALIDLAIKDFNEGDYDLIETAFNGLQQEVWRPKQVYHYIQWKNLMYQ